MTPVTKILLSALAAAALAGCTQNPLGQDVATRNASAQTLAAHPATQTDAQAAALGQMMDKLVRASTRKGILTGGAIGCGLVVVSAGNAKNCAAGALAGGAIGGVVGYQKGKAEVARSVETVSANELTRNLRASNNSLDDLRIGLRETLAAQDTELAEMRVRRTDGSISEAAYLARVAEIRAYRVRLVDALSQHKTRADEATANLEKATRNGQSGLDWHMSATRQLSRDVASARSEITLL